MSEYHSSKIIHIDIKLPEQEYLKALNDFKDNYSPSNIINVSTKDMSTKNGREMIKTTIVNNYGDEVNILCERDPINKNVIFKSFKISNMGNSFYEVIYKSNGMYEDSDPENPMEFTIMFLKSLCRVSGTIGYISSDLVPCLIVDGIYAGCNITLLDTSDLSVYGYNEIDSDNTNIIRTDDVTIKTPINEWLLKHQDIVSQIASIPEMSDKINYIGKYLINAKLNNSIDSNEFYDIFYQAGVMGFTDAAVLNVYKLLF